MQNLTKDLSQYSESQTSDHQDNLSNIDLLVPDSGLNSIIHFRHVGHRKRNEEASPETYGRDHSGEQTTLLGKQLESLFGEVSRRFPELYTLTALN